MKRNVNAAAALLLTLLAACSTQPAPRALTPIGPPASAGAGSGGGGGGY